MRERDDVIMLKTNVKGYFWGGASYSKQDI